MEPEQYTDEYVTPWKQSRKRLSMAQSRSCAVKKTRPSNVVDLVSVLQESTQQSQGKAKVDKPERLSAR
jgi:non-homologous end joining protein Ku